MVIDLVDSCGVGAVKKSSAISRSKDRNFAAANFVK
jgi:hypothetical protein